MRRALLPLFTVVIATTALGAQHDVLPKIRDEALTRSQVMTYFDHLVTGIGPRLTGSP